MNVFAVISIEPSPALESAITSRFQNDHLRINDTVTLVAGPTTSKDVSDQLGITQGPTFRAVVLASTGYFGRAPGHIWEWMQAKAAASSKAA